MPTARRPARTAPSNRPAATLKRTEGRTPCNLGPFRLSAEVLMSSVVVVTGSAGLIGSESVRHFAALGMDVVGVDNDMRGYFFGKDGSTKWNLDRLRKEVGERYTHHDIDIRD